MSILRVPCKSGYRPMVYPRKVLGRSVKDRVQVQDFMATGGKDGTEVVSAFAESGAQTSLLASGIQGKRRMGTPKGVQGKSRLLWGAYRASTLPKLSGGPRYVTGFEDSVVWITTLWTTTAGSTIQTLNV